MDNQATYDHLLSEIGDGVPNADQYQRLGAVILDHPEARRLQALDPFSPAYREGAMALYLEIRGREGEGYLAHRDERAPEPATANIWTDIVPWSFRDAATVAEHVTAWGAILGHLALPPGGRLLEYGPGSGQVLLAAARLGYEAFGVDINAGALATIERQAAAMGVTVRTEAGRFGEGFGDERFDTILFYEAFHHEFQFNQLLLRLHDRLNPGGRVILCGEPIVSVAAGSVPYPWGPRLDGLSVFCIRKFGWMELGYTHEFLLEAIRRAGWEATHHPHPTVGRAAIHVLQRLDSASFARREAVLRAQLDAADVARRREIAALSAELAGVHASTSWRMTAPMRAVMRRLRGR